MALPFHSYADSKPFKFLVGAAAKPFFIHSKLAAHQSRTLATLIDGAMIEAKREYAVFDDVDEETFIRFMQFAYTGDYSVAEPDVVLFQQDIGVENGVGSGGSNSPKIVHDSDASPEEAPPEDAPLEEAVPEVDPVPGIDDLDWSSPTHVREKGKKKKKKKTTNWPSDWGNGEGVSAAQEALDESPEVPPDADIYPYQGGAWSYGKGANTASRARKSQGQLLWESFQDKAIVNIPSPAWEPSSNEDDCEDFTPVFLCHAKLYVLSDKYGIEPLQELVLQKLRLTLSRFILHSRRAGDVVELVKYAYEHTTEYRGGGSDGLRDLVTDYAVCHVEELVKYGGFTKLMQENGDVTQDIMPKLMERMD